MATNSSLHGHLDPSALTPAECPANIATIPAPSAPRHFEPHPRIPTGPVIGFLHPAEMTPEERTDELAAILAAGFLHLRAGMAFPESQGETAGAATDKFRAGAESHLEPVSETRMCG